MLQTHREGTKRCKKLIAMTVIILALLVAINGCASKPKKQAKSKPKSQSAQSNMNKVITASGQKIDYEVSIGTLKLTDPSKLPGSGFGRENPFLPIVSRRQVKESSHKNVQRHMPAGKITPENSPIELSLVNKLAKPRSETSNKPPVNLKLTLIMDDSTAMFEENKVSKYVSEGDTIGGLKVIEIRSNEVILSDGDKTYPVRVGATFTFQQRT